MTTAIISYAKNSASARALAAATGWNLHGKKITKATMAKYDRLVYWGASSPGVLANKQVLNHPRAISIAQDKARSLAAMSSNMGVYVPDDRRRVRVPQFTNHQAIARQWYEEDVPMMARTLLNSSSGKGCYYINPLHGDEFITEMDGQRVRLYTRYVKKAQEWRIHCAQGEAFFIQQKRKRAGVEDANYQIRSHANGWVFCHNEIDVCPDRVVNAARYALEAIGLDFGAVDVVYNRHTDCAVVLEVNTAPGLEGTTVDKYAEKLSAMVGEARVAPEEQHDMRVGPDEERVYISPPVAARSPALFTAPEWITNLTEEEMDATLARIRRAQDQLRNTTEPEGE